MKTAFSLTVLLSFSLESYAQSQLNQPQTGKLAFVLPSLLDQALSGAGSLAPALRTAILPRWVSLNTSVAVQLSNLPLPSPASALRDVDTQAGAPRTVPQSWGPILTERAETIGAGKFYVALSHQRFSFDTLDLLNLSGFQVVSPLTIPAGSLLPVDIPALVSAEGYINVSINQSTAHFTYGLNHRIDLSYAFPIVTSEVTVRGGATLRNTTNGQTILPLPVQLVNLKATGLGDGTARLKARVWEHGDFGLAFATDVRLPIGDEFNYHGAGAFGVKETLILSWNRRRFSPHLNAGYQWNGESYLASQYPDSKRNLPGQIVYALGFDSGLSDRMTLAMDFSDQVIIGGQRTFLRPYRTSDGSEFSEIYFDDVTRHELNASIGMKGRIASNLLLTGNVVMRLNQTGLRARVIPFIGLSYLF